MDRKETLSRRIADAEAAFSDHALVEAQERAWRIARRREDGSLDVVFSAEVFAGWNGTLYVGGDIDSCAFAYGPRHPVHMVEWIGEQGPEDLEYYVAQKAVIGTDRKTVWRYSLEEARMGMAANIDDDDPECLFRKWVEDYGDDDLGTMDAFIDSMEDVGFSDPWELATIGERLESTVIYAWAAVSKLSELLKR